MRRPVRLRSKCRSDVFALITLRVDTGLRVEMTLSCELQPGRRDEAVERGSADGHDWATMAEVLAQVLKPESIGNQRGLRLDYDQVFGPLARGNLQDETGTLNCRSCR